MAGRAAGVGNRAGARPSSPSNLASLDVLRGPSRPRTLIRRGWATAHRGQLAEPQSRSGKPWSALVRPVGVPDTQV